MVQQHKYPNGFFPSSFMAKDSVLFGQSADPQWHILDPRRATELVSRIQSLTTFVDTAKSLITCTEHHEFDFRLHGRKVNTLSTIATSAASNHATHLDNRLS